MYWPKKTRFHLQKKLLAGSVKQARTAELCYRVEAMIKLQRCPTALTTTTNTTAITATIQILDIHIEASHSMLSVTKNCLSVPLTSLFQLAFIFLPNFFYDESKSVDNVILLLYCHIWQHKIVRTLKSTNSEQRRRRSLECGICEASEAGVNKLTKA